MAKISEYGNYGENVPSGGTTAKFQETGVIPVSGKYKDDGTMETRNVKMSDLVGGGGGDAESLAGRGLHASDGKLTVDTDSTLTIAEVGYLSETRYKVSVTNAVPTPGASHADAGKVLTVKTIDNTDSLVWDSPAVPEISQYNGDVSVVNATNDVSSGGYVFDVNLDSDTLEKRSTEGANQVSYIAVKNPVPDTTDASSGDVLTFNGSTIGWAAPQGGGGGGGLSPISPTAITPTLENNTYKIVIPGNNAYYIATINGDTHDVEITPPTIGANEMYNIVLFVVSNDAGDKQMTMAYGDYDISPMDDESRYGWVYGLAFTQFVFLGRGFTMKTSAYSGG